MLATKAQREVQKLWAEWRGAWGEMSATRRIAPALCIVFYWIALGFLGGLRSEHLSLGAGILVLFYGGPRLSPLLRFALPFFLTGVIYDSMRYYGDLIRGPIHVAEPYRFDLRFFGILYGGKRLTPNEWWQLHTHPALDFLTGLAYLIFVGIYVGVAGYFRFFQKDPAARADAQAMPWAFLAVNLIGYSTYYWFAAAPPWYVSLYGLGPPRMDVRANPAGTVRFDALLGTHFFSGMYGRAADVFGAVPSLHVAYPLIAAFYATRYRKLAPFCWAFYLWMCFSAVYLNHHYVLDILWGSAYAVIVTAAAWIWAKIRAPLGSSPRASREPSEERLCPEGSSGRTALL